MIFFFQELVHENHGKEGSHHEVDSLCGKRKNIPEKRSDAGADDPIALIEKGDKKHKPFRVYVLRNLCAVIDTESFITHPEDKIEALPPGFWKFVQHRYAVEQVTKLNHYRKKKGLQRSKGRKKKANRQNLQGTAKNERGHKEGIEYGKTRTVHIDPVSKAEE